MTLPILLRRRFLLLRFFMTAIVCLLGFFMDHTSMIQAQTPIPDDILYVLRTDAGWRAYVMNGDGTDQRIVTKQLNFPRSYIQEYAAVFSPDQTQIVLAVIKTDMATSVSEYRLYRVNADGKGLKLLWTGHADYLDPIWSPKGDQILFSGHTERVADVYVINVDGSGLKNLTSGDSNYNPFPVWSPSGEHIFFTTDADTESGSARFVMNADGTEVHQAEYRHFVWSPDEQQIVFISPEDGELYRVNQDGSGLKRLTQLGLSSSPIISNLVWSPDGRHLAFMAVVQEQGDQRNLYMITPDGSELTQLTYAEEGQMLNCLEWLPNSEQLITTMYQEGDNSQNNIYAVQADGSGVMTQLTDSSGGVSLPNCSPLFG